MRKAVTPVVRRSNLLFDASEYFLSFLCLQVSIFGFFTGFSQRLFINFFDRVVNRILEKFE